MPRQIRSICTPAWLARYSPCTIFGSNNPNVGTFNDGQQIELGVKFRTSTDGNITALRFYKTAGNGGTHTAHLWTANGQGERLYQAIAPRFDGMFLIGLCACLHGAPALNLPTVSPVISDASPPTAHHQNQVTAAHPDGHYRRARPFRYEKVTLP